MQGRGRSARCRHHWRCLSPIGANPVRASHARGAGLGALAADTFAEGSAVGVGCRIAAATLDRDPVARHRHALMPARGAIKEGE